jgi:alkaline phosphatase D
MKVLGDARSAHTTKTTVTESPAGPPSVTRRGFVIGAGTGAAGLVMAPSILKGARGDTPVPTSSLFTLGVASGDPRATSVVIWTRLAPDPLNGGGMPVEDVRVVWEVATDEGFATIVASGRVKALPRFGHAINVLVTGLLPGAWYFYRFRALGEVSRTGRVRTFPAPGQVAPRMRFAVVSCQHYEQGFYPAWGDIASWRGQGDADLDFVVHTGDYIYEGGGTRNPIAPGRVHVGGEVFSVADYRNRYAQYRLDQNLQTAHANFPFIATWDDHEVDNNYAAEIAEEGAPFQGADFIERKRNAYQVYAETMPLRPQNRVGARSGSFRLFRRFRFGDLADIHVLDTRQYRSDQAAQDGFGSTDPDSALLEPAFGEQLFDAAGITDPNRTLLGAEQEAWLFDGLRRSNTRWNVIAQQVMMTEWNLVETARLNVANDPTIPDPVKAQILALFGGIDNVYNVDAWDGYQAARQRLFQVLDTVRPNNPVVVTGDIHSAWGANLLKDFADSNSDILAAEFVCTSISSTFLTFDPRPVHAIVKAGVVADNPHIPYFNGLFRGYTLCDVDADRWQSTYRAVGDVAQLANPDPLALVPFEGLPVATDAVLEIEAGFNAPGSGARIDVKSARPFPPPL